MWSTVELTEASWNCLEKLMQISLHHSLLKLKIKLSLKDDVKNIKIELSIQEPLIQFTKD